MKKTIAALMLLALFIPAMAGCGKKNAPPTFEESGWAETEDTIAVDSRTDWSEPAL